MRAIGDMGPGTADSLGVAAFCTWHVLVLRTYAYLDGLWSCYVLTKLLYKLLMSSCKRLHPTCSLLITCLLGVSNVSIYSSTRKRSIRTWGQQEWPTRMAELALEFRRMARDSAEMQKSIDAGPRRRCDFCCVFAVFLATPNF